MTTRLSLGRVLVLTTALAAAAVPALADQADRETLRQAFEHVGMAKEAAGHDIELLNEIIDEYADRHVDGPDSHMLAATAAAAIIAAPAGGFRAATAALTQALDPHSTYLPEQEWKDMQVTVSGQFSGLGLELAKKDQAIVVIAPVENSPAAEAGILADDQILEINEQPVQGLPLTEVVHRIRGPVGSPVNLLLRSRDGRDRRLSLVRGIIHLHPVAARLMDDVAYVRLSRFSGGVTALLRQKLDDLNHQAAFGVKGVVLDLRGNPGGLLDEAVKVSDLFIGAVPIVITKGRAPDDTHRRMGHRGEILAGVPMVVLIDDNTASAAEIVAAALHDNHRALLVGQKSYGKGSVQILEGLSEGGVRITIARYFRPNQQPVDQIGIPPDITVETKDGETKDGGDRQLEQALTSLHR